VDRQLHDAVRPDSHVEAVSQSSGQRDVYNVALVDALTIRGRFFLRPVAATFCLSVCLLAVTSDPSHAQGNDRSAIVGRVSDATGAVVAHASIVAASPALIGGPRPAIATEGGAFRIVDLTAGTYQVTVAVPGFEKAVRTVHLPVDATITVDIVLEVASLAESVQVSGVAPLIDVKSAQVVYALPSDFVTTLPTSRVISDLINLMPGINVGIGFGGVQQSNPHYIDGVNVTDAQALSPWASYDYNWIEDVQVVGVGAGAEYGEFSGIIQKSRLRSGGNQFSGLAEYRTTRPGWVGSNTSSLTPSVQSMFAAQSQRILDWRDTSVQAGGPIRSDHVWFFSGIQDARSNVVPALYAGPHSTESRQRRVLIKIDAAVAGSLRLNGYYEHDRSHLSGGGLGPLTPVEATTTETHRDHNGQARASKLFGDATMIEGAYAGSTGLLTDDPAAPATRSGPSPHYDLVTGLSSVSTGFLDFGSARVTLGGTVSHYLTGGWGRHHEVRLGIQHERARVTTTVGFPGGRSYLDMDGAPYLVQLRDEERDLTRTRRTTAYLQDEWAIGERVTLQPGVRLSVNRGVVSQKTVFSTNPVSPRIGMAWDVAGDHGTTVRLHYGRYHDAVLTAQFAFADDQQPTPTISAQVIGPDQFVEISRTTAAAYDVDPELSQGFFDQWLIGVERELWSSTSASVQYIRRRYSDQMGFLDVGSIYEPVVRTDPGIDNRLGTADDGRSLTLFRKTNPGSERYVFTNPSGVHRRYDAVQIIGRRQHGSWQVHGSYVWSSTRGNAVNGLRSNSGGPDLGFNGVTADPNRAINADGPMPFDFTHELKTLATWRAPWWGGLNVSGAYQYHTGSAWGRTAQFSNLQFVTFGVRIEPRGTRRTAALNTLDLRVEKTFTTGRGRIGVFGDVFNVGNQGIPDPAMRRPVVEFSGPSFGQPMFWLSPRTLRAGVRVSF
jgi:hypothetical protein